jgi:hypothetical protein
MAVRGTVGTQRGSFSSGQAMYRQKIAKNHGNQGVEAVDNDKKKKDLRN